MVRKAPWLSISTFLFGIPGAAYLFRPVISSNLRVLKVHHSLVTNIPTIACRSTDVLAELWLAETYLRERLDLAYPQTYVPDMNPRLYSLTLCMIPRHSTGAVTKRLINFLKLAARQEQMIEKVRASTPLRGPPVLEGLRHIRLEFESEAKHEIASLDDEDDELDAGALLNRGEETFSFFSQSSWDQPSSSVSSKVLGKRVTSCRVMRPAQASKAGNNETETPAPEKLDCAPFNQAQNEHIDVTIKPANTRDKEVVLPVWVGTGVISPANPPAVNEYMRNLCDPAMVGADGVTAATPYHVVAGVPAGSLIFHRAWDAMLLPTVEEIRRPSKAALRGMKDVLGEIKAFRLEARRRFAEMEAARVGTGAGEHEHEHEHWKGNLVVALAPDSSLSSDYWR